MLENTPATATQLFAYQGVSNESSDFPSTTRLMRNLQTENRNDLPKNPYDTFATMMAYLLYQISCPCIYIQIYLDITCLSKEMPPEDEWIGRKLLSHWEHTVLILFPSPHYSSLGLFISRVPPCPSRALIYSTQLPNSPNHASLSYLESCHSHNLSPI